MLDTVVPGSGPLTDAETETERSAAPPQRRCTNTDINNKGLSIGYGAVFLNDNGRYVDARR